MPTLCTVHAFLWAATVASPIRHSSSARNVLLTTVRVRLCLADMGGALCWGVLVCCCARETCSGCRLAPGGTLNGCGLLRNSSHTVVETIVFLQTAAGDAAVAEVALSQHCRAAA